MNIRERLEKLNPALQKKEITVPRTYEIPYKKVLERLEGELIEISSGKVLLKRHIYPIPYYTGQVRLHPESFSPIGLSKLNKKKNGIGDFDARNMVFLDTETTGLAGGTGTYIFLIGMGYFDEETFVVDQYFLLDYSQEIAFLDILNDFLRNYSLLVTYNGKAFDMNLLQTRYNLNRIETLFKFEEHFDLLHSSRQIWKRRLESCSLKQVEQSILGIIRKEDIPGSMIPQIYFDYATHGDLDFMPMVLEHNKMDILSLAGLTCFVSQCAESPLSGRLSHGTDYYSLGRFYYGQGEWDSAISCFERALEFRLSDSIRFKTQQELAMIYKRQRNWEKALELWKQIIEGNTVGKEIILIEMAKYYEHRAKDYEAARLIIENQLLEDQGNASLQRAIQGHFIKPESSLQKRLERIKRKEKKDKEVVSSNI